MMKNSYTHPLKVSTPEGKRIIVTIYRSANKAIIEIPFIEGVKKDDPPFACNGQISFSCEREKYAETINILERYLEDIFLKGMANEDIYSSLGVKPKRRRAKGQGTKRKITIDKRKGDSASLHDSTGREESSESPGTGNADNEMAEDSNPEVS